MRPDRSSRGPRRQPASAIDRTDERLTRMARRLAAGRAPDAAFEGDVIPMTGEAGNSDPELARLAAELERAGERARFGDAVTQSPSAPAPGFAAALRERLLADLPQPIAEARPPLAAAGPPRPSADAVMADLRATAARSVTPRVAWRGFGQMAAPRWTALAAAAVIVLAALGLNSSRLLPSPAQTRVESAVGTMLIRDGERLAATSGTALLAGDTVTVADGGAATLRFDASEARLAAGAVVRIDGIGSGGIALTQMAGRAYHRVDLPTGQTYSVQTASVTWTARGTAFDVDRRPIEGATGERVTVTAIQHSVAMHGPDVDGILTEGRQAVVLLGAETPDIATAAVPGDLFVDPWIVANARRDRVEGRELGILANLDIADASAPADPVDNPSDPIIESDEPVMPAESPDGSDPAASPNPTSEPTTKPTPTPTPRTTPRPTPEPTPTPTPKPASINLAAFGCDGGVLLDWAPYTGDGFRQSVVVWSTSSSIPATWPPGDGAVAIDGASTTNQAISDGAQSTPDGALGTRYYRAFILGADNHLLAVSSVKSATTQGIASLGTLTVGPGDTGTAFGWTAFGGSGDCFTVYTLVWSAASSNPSYLGDHDGAIAIAGQGTTGATSSEVGAGPEWFRIQVIRSTSLGSFVVAQTDAIQYTVP